MSALYERRVYNMDEFILLSRAEQAEREADRLIVERDIAREEADMWRREVADLRRENKRLLAEADTEVLSRG